MLAVYNRLDINVTCLGNHDTDFGLDRMTELIRQTNSPWIMSNLFYKAGGVIGGLERYKVIQH